MRLLAKLSSRKNFHARWALRDFLVAQVFVWLAIGGSFVASILSTIKESIHPAVLATVAAIPAAVILIDRSFSFAKRAKWHYMFEAELERLANAVEFEGKDVAAVAHSFGELRVQMERSFPSLAVDGLDDSGRKREKEDDSK